MENLVRRLGRILNKKKVKQGGHPVRTGGVLQACGWTGLENALLRWVAQGGWRLPRRTLSEAATDLGTDTVTLHHYFQERTGLDFRTWRTRLRLEEAARLLVEEPETKVLDIAERVGFSNRSNFSRQFLAYTGMTPAQWRGKARTSLDGRA